MARWNDMKMEVMACLRRGGGKQWRVDRSRYRKPSMKNDAKVGETSRMEGACSSSYRLQYIGAQQKARAAQMVGAAPRPLPCRNILRVGARRAWLALERRGVAHFAAHR